MIRKITLENYMAHAHTVIEPAAGLTVLVGPNNCGKSAVVAALETLCSNATGDYMVRHHEKRARVTVETAEGHTLVWQRRGTTVSYLINGRAVHRLGRAVPEELHKLLRLPKVASGELGEPFDIHFGTQKAPIFLLDEPESRAALFFASSSDTALLLEMQRRHRQNVKDRRHDERRLQEELLKLDTELATLRPLAHVAPEVERLERAFRDLQVHEEQQGQLQVLLQTLARLLTDQVQKTQLFTGLSALQAPPAWADAPALAATIAPLMNWQARLVVAREEYAVVSRALPPPHLGDAVQLELQVHALQAAEAQWQAQAAVLGVLVGLARPPEVQDPEPLRRLLAGMREPAQIIADSHNTLQELAEPFADAQKWLKLSSAAAPSPSERRWALPPALAAALVLGMCISLFLPKVRQGRAPLSRSEPVSVTEPRASQPAETATVQKPLASASVPAERGKSVALPDPARATTRAGSRSPTPAPRRNEADRAGDNGHADNVVDSRGVTNSKSQPAQGKPAAARHQLARIQALLDEAEEANGKGRYLEAALRWGEVALRHAALLPQVASPDAVQKKFVNALKHYQQAVERALHEARLAQPRDQPTDPAAGKR